MSNEDVLAAVREFFRRVDHAGLVLPNGWFGRPYDNLLQLTRVEADETSLLIELDGQLILTFAGEPKLTASDRGLRLSRFVSLAWDWTEFGTTVLHHEHFSSVTVEFVEPID